MSRKQIFIFVEGWSDRNIYDRIADNECKSGGVEREVMTANELPQGTGGKEVLVKFFAYLRRRECLAGEFKGKSTAVLFFLDKDIDDVLRRQKRSAHLVYTQYYDFENYVFRFGDIVRAGAAAASLDEASVRSAIGNQQQWLAKAAAAWADWTALCVLSRRCRASCSVSYRRQSLLNSMPYAAVDQTALTTLSTQLQLAIGDSQKRFGGRLRRVRKQLADAVSAGTLDKWFKGKWYKYFLASDLRTLAAGRSINSNGLEDRLVELLKMTLDVNGTWANRYHAALRAAIASL